MASTKCPPLLSKTKSYEDWLKLIKVWRNLTSLEPEKQASAIVLSLEGEAQVAVLELNITEISDKDGVDKIIDRLNQIYKKDELTEKYNALEAFETYKRPTNIPIRDFLTEFEKRHHKTKSFGVTMSDDLLAYRLLKAANLTTRDEQLVKATVTELQYSIVKSKLIKIFSDNNDVPTSKLNEMTIKTEPVLHTQCHSTQQESNPILYQDEAAYYDQCSEDEQYQSEQQNTTLLAHNRYQQQFPVRPRTNNMRFRPHPPQQKSSNPNWRAQRPSAVKRNIAKTGRNPVDKFGVQTKCSVCESINHWAQNCPDREPEHNTYVINEVVLHQSDIESTQELKHLMAETWSSALLDCGASKTVCGKEWLNQYINNLQEDGQRSVKFTNSHHVYRFGDGRKIKAIHSATIPAVIGKESIYIQTDVLDNDIPLLFSRSSMKKAKMTINFQNDTINAFGVNIPLITTSSGHYAIPLTPAKQLINNLDRSKDSNSTITLTLTEEKSSKDMALKLHRQFAHPTSDKLIKLINSAGYPWAQNTELKQEIKTISENCPTCSRYKKAPPDP